MSSKLLYHLSFPKSEAYTLMVRGNKVISFDAAKLFLLSHPNSQKVQIQMNCTLSKHKSEFLASIKLCTEKKNKLVLISNTFC